MPSSAQKSTVSRFNLIRGHTQTLLPALFAKRPIVDYRRERWVTPDADFIDIDFIDGDKDRPFVVLFHGLEGSSNSHYARALMAHLHSLGWSAAVPHFRGCSGEINQNPRFYHSGDAAEIEWIARRLHQSHQTKNPNGKFYACGVSLGGNALLRFLGEAQTQASFIDAACAISAPLNLTQSGAALSRGFNHIYTRNFLQTLKPKCLEKLKQFPNLFDAKKMLAARTLYEFDDVVTAPLHGYRDVDDYWHSAGACHVLNEISIPTWVLNAQNDPFMPAQYLPQNASKFVTLDYPIHGGHAGFSKLTLHAKNKPSLAQNLPEKISQFLQDHG